MLDKSITLCNLRLLKKQEVTMIRVDQKKFESLQGRKPGKMEFGSWIFRIGMENFWIEYCHYSDAVKKARTKARKMKIKKIDLLP